MSSYKDYLKAQNLLREKLKARFIKAIPYLAGVEFSVYPRKTIWQGELVFKSRASAARFVQEADYLGHSAKGEVRIKHRGLNWVRTQTFDTVFATLDKTKAKPKPVPPPFDPKSVAVDLVPGQITRSDALAAIKKFPVGVKVMAVLAGKKVDDAVVVNRCGDEAKLVVRPDGLEFEVPFGNVSMQWDARRRVWDLSYRCSSGGSNIESLRATNVALWKVLCTTWNIGIRGVIM